jgi:hypothetical protein
LFSLLPSLILISPPIHRYGQAEEYVDESGAVQSNYEGKGVFTSLQVACIEQLLTAKGEIFVGTAMSTFTKEVGIGY